MAKLRSNPPRLKDGNQGITRAASWRDGMSSTARGYGYEWQQARAEYLAEHPFCVSCYSRGVFKPATHLDHIKPHKGDAVLFWDRSNWQGLCSHCHNALKQRAERADAAGSHPIPKPTRTLHNAAQDAAGLTTGVGGVKVPPPVDP